MLTFELPIKPKYFNFNSIAISSFEFVNVGPGI